MRPFRLAATIAALTLSVSALAAAQAEDSLPAHIAAALTDDMRPEADTELDAGRHPGEVIAFAGVEPGWHVADLTAGTGYYTRVLAASVGADGHVYAHNPDWVAQRFQETDAALAGLADSQANITHVVSPIAGFADDIDEPLDAVFMVLFYHDTIHDGTDRAAMNQAIYDALRPGGVYIVIDHHAQEGAGEAVADTLHRMEASLAESEVTAAGFVLDGQSDVLANPDDPRDISVFDPAIRRQTDRFVYRFRKPEM